jgi:hypothetical protein
MIIIKKTVRMSIDYEIDDNITNIKEKAYSLFEKEFETKIYDTDSFSDIKIIENKEISIGKTTYEDQLKKILNSKTIDINDLRSLNDKLYFYIIDEFEKKKN